MDGCYPYTALKFGAVRFNVTGLATLILHNIIVCWRTITCCTGGRDVLPPRYGVFLFVGTASAVLGSCRATFTGCECWVSCDAGRVTGVGLRTD